jgi:hypothetical protein
MEDTFSHLSTDQRVTLRSKMGCPLWSPSLANAVQSL